MRLRLPIPLPRFRAGFTLVEINLVLLLFGVGITALLGLFPVGLRQGALAGSDTREAVFAEMILNTVQAQALSQPGYASWQSEAAFESMVRRAKIAGEGKNAKPDTALSIGNEVTFEKYLGAKRNVIRYLLTIEDISDSRPMYRATVQVSDRMDGAIKNCPTYSLDLVYLGSVP